MVYQKALDALIKIDDGAGGFNTVAAVQTRTLSLNQETVDVTNQDSANRWRELLAGAGAKSATISGDGVFNDATSDEDIRASFFNGTHLDYQFIIPDFGTIEGKFQVSSLEYSGNHNEPLAFSASFESAGELTFTAA